MSLNYDKIAIKKLFRTKLSKKLASMESERKSLKRQGTFHVILGSAFAIIILVDHDIIQKHNISPGDLLFIIVIAWLIFLAPYVVKYKKYKKKFKQQIIKEVIQAILPGSNYSPEKHIPRSDYQNSSFFLTSENRYSGEDLITHTYKGINFQFSELTTKKVTGSGKNRSTKIIFRGIFLTCDLPYKIKHRTLVLPDLSERAFGRLIGKFLQSKNITRDELVKLEDINFEKHFVVYSKDQIEARKILTPRMMEKILHYNKKTRHTIHLCFEPSKLYLAIPMNKNYFEPNLSSGIKFKDIRDICELIHTLTSIIDVLELQKEDYK